MRRAFVLVVAVGLAGIAATAIALVGGSRVDDRAEAAQDRAPHAAAQGSVKLIVEQRGSIGFTEGGFTFLEVKRPSGDNGPSSYGRPVDAQFLGSRFDAGYSLPRNSRFRIVSYQRACGGFCSRRSLDPRSNGCSAVIATGDAEAVTARIATRGPGGYCSIKVGYAQATD